MKFDLHELYTDGGVIGHNPSYIGGMWAHRLIANDVMVVENSGIITPFEAGLPIVSNNLTELLALVNGMGALPADWKGTVCSDSQISLGRVFLHWKMKGIPLWLSNNLDKVRSEHQYFSEWKWILLQGHPTKADLALGKGSRGYPVSEHNVWCDQTCAELGKAFVIDHEPFEEVT